jgi:sec-independent protein translocase protein TatC
MSIEENDKSDSVSKFMSLGDHLEELRARLILAAIGLAIALIAALFFGKYIIGFLEKPYVDAMGTEARLQSLAPTDGFVSYMNICLIAGAIVSSPWIFYQLWMFVSAGLYAKEKKYVYRAIPFSAGLFITGALFFIFVLAPATIKFLITFNKEFLGVDSNFTFNNYISFITVMMLIFGIAFQTPIVIFIITKIGIVTTRTLKDIRKYVVLGIIVVAAAATPGSDLFSLFGLSIPLYLLYELGIIISDFSAKKKIKEQAS